MSTVRCDPCPSWRRTIGNSGSLCAFACGRNCHKNQALQTSLFVQPFSVIAILSSCEYSIIVNTDCNAYMISSSSNQSSQLVDPEKTKHGFIGAVPSPHTVSKMVTSSSLPLLSLYLERSSGAKKKTQLSPFRTPQSWRPISSKLNRFLQGIF